MTSVTLEELLETCYPVCFSLLNDGFLSAIDITTLRGTSRFFKKLVDSTPITNITFHRRGDDPKWDRRVECWGTKKAFEMFHCDDEEPAATVRRKTAMGIQIKHCSFGWDRISLVLTSLISASNLQSLCLDRTSVNDNDLRSVFSTKQYPQLRHLSLVCCGSATVGGIAALMRKYCQGKPAMEFSIKILKVWMTADVQRIVSFLDPPSRQGNFTEAQCGYNLRRTMKSLEYLSSKFELDTGPCDSHSDPVVPAQRHGIPCSSCKKISDEKECLTCLMEKCCEVCEKHYCKNCNPWKSPTAESSDHTSYQPLVLQSKCSFDDESWWHKGNHYFHLLCSEKRPTYPNCKFCDKIPCRWNSDFKVRCKLCDAACCFDCKDELEGYVKRCAYCETTICAEHFFEKTTESRFLRCSAKRCDFWMCGSCVGGGGLFFSAFSIGSALCTNCRDLSWSEFL